MGTHYACPVCNGFSALEDHRCPGCGHVLEDNGRFTDLFSDYSPYREIDDLKMTDGLTDLKTRQCPHALTCPACVHSKVLMVDEIPIS